MKKILLAATLLVALTSATFADGKNSNAKLLSDLKTALKSVDESTWKSTDSYRKATFNLNGKNVSAFVNPETTELIGFSFPIEASALPEGTTENVAKKYQGWQMINPIMFINAAGQVSYFVQVNKGQNSLALRISSTGKPSIYGRMYQ
jgi:hypothetical protein